MSAVRPGAESLAERSVWSAASTVLTSLMLRPADWSVPRRVSRVVVDHCWYCVFQFVGET